MKSDDGKSPSLRNRVHHANGVVWEAVSPRCSRRRRVRRRRRVQPPPRRRASPPPPPARSGGRRSRRCRSPAGPRRYRSPGRCSGCRTCVGVWSAGVGGQTRRSTMRYLMRRDRYFHLHRLRGGDARMRGASSETDARTIGPDEDARAIESYRGRRREIVARATARIGTAARARSFRARKYPFFSIAIDRGRRRRRRRRRRRERRRERTRTTASRRLNARRRASGRVATACTSRTAPTRPW